MATTNFATTTAPANGLINSVAAPQAPTVAAPLPTTAPILPAPTAAPTHASGVTTTMGTDGITPVSQYNAALQTTDAKTDTTQGRLDSMLQADSPYLQRAQAKAAEISNSRGLLNSSMAAGAGTAAAIDAAAPIAQSDANMMMNTRNQNQNAVNTAANFNAGQLNSFGMVDKTTTADVTKIGAQTTADLTKMSAANQITLGQMSASQKNKLQEMATAQGFNMETITATQLNTLARDAILQGYDLTKLDAQSNNTLKQMSAGQLNDLEKMAKAQGYNLETMSATQVNDLAKAAKLQEYTASNMDHASTITLSHMSAAQLNDLEKMATQQGNDLAKMSAAQVNDLAKASVLQGYDLEKMDAQAVITLQQMDAASALDLTKMAAAQGYNLETMDAAQINDLAKMAEANVLDLEKMGAASGYTIDQMKEATTQDLIKMAEAQGYDLEKMAEQQGMDITKMSVAQINDLAKMDKTYTQADKEAQTKFGYDKQLMEIQKSSNIEVAGIEAQYRNLIQASSSAASLSNTVSQSVNQILLNEKLTGDSTQADPDNPGKFLSNKQVAINQVMGNYQNSLQLIGAMSGDVDLSAFLDRVLPGAAFSGGGTDGLPGGTTATDAQINSLYSGNPAATAANPNGPDAAAMAYWKQQVKEKGLDYVRNTMFPAEVAKNATPAPGAGINPVIDGDEATFGKSGPISTTDPVIQLPVMPSTPASSAGPTQPYGGPANAATWVAGDPANRRLNANGQPQFKDKGVWYDGDGSGTPLSGMINSTV